MQSFFEFLQGNPFLLLFLTVALAVAYVAFRTSKGFAWAVMGVVAVVVLAVTAVLGLLLIVLDRWMLIKTVTAFTVAHSITLGIATLGYASAPLPPAPTTRSRPRPPGPASSPRRRSGRRRG